MRGFFKRNCLGLQKFFLLTFAASFCSQKLMVILYFSWNIDVVLWKYELCLLTPPSWLEVGNVIFTFDFYYCNFLFNKIWSERRICKFVESKTMLNTPFKINRNIREIIISTDMNKIVSHKKIHFWKFEKLKYIIK